ncbi:MAG: helix-turn-helix domain-containing protein [Bacteroidota bacterium]
MKTVVNETIPEKSKCVSTVKYISDALYVLNGKWKFPLIFTLKQKPLRFNEILLLVEGITPKVLAKELKDLGANGLIERKVFPTTPVAVLYEATSYSETLNGVLKELGKWGEQHLEKVKQGIRDQNKEADKDL